jgi:hypothetical protein
MKPFPTRRAPLCGFLLSCACLATAGFCQQPQPVTLRTLVTPSTVILKDDRPLTFAIHGFIEFKSLGEVFPYMESQAQHWRLRGVDDAQLARLRQDLLRRGIESRVVSMTDQRPLESLITHTSQELRQALAEVREPVPPGYAEAFLAVQEKWKHSLNCWSASSSIAGRALSNWYPIEEGILLFGSTYDSTEHFWQAVKYHADLTAGDLTDLLRAFAQRDWSVWLKRLDDDATLYLPNAYAVEFLRHNLQPERISWFRAELQAQHVQSTDHVHSVQQRGSGFHFTAYEEKVLWGDLADLFYLVYVFSPANDPIRAMLAARHFDAVYLGDRKMGFISPEFRSLMLEIWKVKYLQMPRFRELIGSIPTEIRLEHFLNDGDSPDIPIPVYVEYLNQIRELARRER